MQYIYILHLYKLYKYIVYILQGTHEMKGVPCNVGHFAYALRAWHFNRITFEGDKRISEK